MAQGKAVMVSGIDENCLRCNARCCRYFCLEVDRPETFEDFQNIRWYMLHEKVSAHIDDEGDWCLLIENPCSMLQDTPIGGRCKDYDNRPLICRRFDPADCEFTRGSWDFQELFATVEELDAYARRMLGEPAWQRGQATMRRPAARTGRRRTPRRR